MAVRVCVWEGAIILLLSIFFGEVNEEERVEYERDFWTNTHHKG